MANKSPEVHNAPNTAKTDPLPSGTRYNWKTIFTPLEFRFLCGCLVLLGFVTLIISVSTDQWLNDGRWSVGLWTSCKEPDCSEDLEMMTEILEKSGIPRAMMVVATACACISVTIISVSFFRNRIFSFSLGYVSAAASFATSIFVLIGMSVYTHQLNDEAEPTVESGWSFDAGWVSFPLFFLAGTATVLLPQVER